MSDRAMIDQAAKAAGYTVAEGPWCNPSYFDGGKLVAEIGKWNPLTDDAHAFRLAVKLGLKDMLILNVGHTGASIEFDNSPACAFEKHAPDPYAATRRAITRAAAAFPLPTPEGAQT